MVTFGLSQEATDTGNKRKNPLVSINPKEDNCFIFSLVLVRIVDLLDLPVPEGQLAHPVHTATHTWRHADIRNTFN